LDALAEASRSFILTNQVDSKIKCAKLRAVIEPMLRTHSSTPESLECLEAPRTALVDGNVLRQVGERWLASQQDRRLSSQLVSTLKALRDRLRTPRVSPLRDFSEQSDCRVARSGATARCCLSTLYELDLLLETFGFREGLKEFSSSEPRRASVSLNHQGEQGAVVFRSVSDTFSVGWIVEVSQFEPAGLRRLLAAAGLAELSRSAGGLLADALDGLLADSRLPSASLEHELFIGQVTLSGPRALKSLCALMSRALPFENFSQYHPNPASVEEAVSSFQAVRCESLGSDAGFRVSSCGIIVIVRGDLGQCSLSLLVNPSEILEDLSGSSFSRSATAEEMASVLLVTGLADCIPEFKDHLCETSLLKKWGNGYAQLSRTLCEMAAGRGTGSLKMLHELDALHGGTLAETLRSFQQLCSSQAARHIIELLASMLTPHSREQLPSFSSDPNKTVYSCADAEACFLQSVVSGAYVLDDEFLHKHEGERTAITRVPIIVNGVQFPRGTLCAVRVRDGERVVTPGRLTAFSLPVSELRDVFECHLERPSLIPAELVDRAFSLTQALLRASPS
jgi:hypothetical protein